MREWFIEQLAMYAAYHRDGRNQATHHIGVPMIVYSLLLAASQAHLVTLPGPDGPLVFSLGSFIFVALVAFHLSNVFVIGLIAALIYGVLYALAESVGSRAPATVWTIFGICFVGGWIIQFVGHYFEGRRPAVFSNATQVFMAPPFLIAEMLFALGQQKNLEGEIQSRSVKYNAVSKTA
ncbi:MAG: DUF962 domain-containing protein [Alphaproteobacteria bacterium]|nr:DUF962 domain-containing protein [Alphaproteobacteria bacterium]PHY00445.1 MAG: hypothetical protein CK529_05635 [Rhodospirillaceae bacterium]